MSKQSGEKYLRITLCPRYLISKNKVIRSLNGDIMYPDSNDKVILHGKKYDVNMLYTSTWFGISENIKIDSIGNYIVKNIEKCGNDIKLDGELFKHMKDFDGYYMNIHGLIYSLKRHIFMKRAVSHNNYMTIGIYDNHGVRSPKKVHRLVYATWVMNESIYKLNGTDLQVDHKDRNNVNNHPLNLNATTAKENLRNTTISEMKGVLSYSDKEYIKDLLLKDIPDDDIIKQFAYKISSEDMIKVIHSLFMKILNQDFVLHKMDIEANRKLTDDQVREIYRLYKDDKFSMYKIAPMFDVSINTISKIINGELYSTLLNPSEDSVRSKFTDDEIRFIRTAHSNGISKGALSKTYSTSTSYITDIIEHKVYKNVS